jgi:hypothetical protein
MLVLYTSPIILFSFGATAHIWALAYLHETFSVSLQFTRSWAFGTTPLTGDQLVARPLPVHKHRKTHIHKHLTSMP